jgi:type II secretory pathway component GspD/PulD (secretin)
LNNQTAKVQVGQQIPIPSFERNENTGSMEVSGFTYRDTGVVLNVTPHINDANEILVDLKPEVSSVGTTSQNFGDFLAPTFTTTAADTQVMIQSGQTIAIGGLLTDNDSEVISKVPYFSEIPVIGKLLFKNQNKSADGNTDAETIFFVTVTSVDTKGQPVSDSARKDDLSSQTTASTSDPKAAPSASVPSGTGQQAAAA